MIRVSLVRAGVLGAMTVVAACGTVKTNSGSGGVDGAPGGGDGGATGGGEGLPAIAGTWAFQIESSDGAISDPCEVLVDEDSAWTVRCPYVVAPSADEPCYRIAGRTELTGTWNELFEGTAEDVGDYAGTCEQDQVRTTDFTMAASRAAEVVNAGFMAGLAGSWAWTATDYEDPTSQFGCTATFTPTPTSLDFVVECQGEGRIVSPGCTRYDTIDIRGGIEAARFQAEMTFPSSFDPEGCSPYDPPEALTLIATRVGD